MDIPAHIIEEGLNRVTEILISKFNELGMSATGQWLRELEQRPYVNRGEIWGMPYTEQLVRGRPPGSLPPIAPLELWVQAKFGLSGKEATSAAFAVAHKISDKGTTWYEQGGSDLLEVLESDEAFAAFYGAINDYLLAEVRLTLGQDLKRGLELAV